MKNMDMHRHQNLFRTNEYPDLDYIPKYPWAGVVNSQSQPVHHTESSGDLDRSSHSPAAHHDLGDPGVGETACLGESVLIDCERNNEEAQWQPHWYASGTSANHGIELGKENSR